MKVSVRTYLTAGLAVASAGFIAATPIASAQPDDGSTNQRDRSGASSASARVGQDASDTRSTRRSSLRPGGGGPAASAADSQADRGTRSRPSTAGTTANRAAASRVTNAVRSFGASRSRVTVTANGSIRTQPQIGPAAGVSATAASAADSAAEPSPGQTINAAVRRALAGQTSATTHANAAARASSNDASTATVGTQRATTSVPSARPARSSSPYAGNH
jgi:hypothetical protein